VALLDGGESLHTIGGALTGRMRPFTDCWRIAGGLFQQFVGCCKGGERHLHHVAYSAHSLFLTWNLRVIAEWLEVASRIYFLYPASHVFTVGGGTPWWPNRIG
jgi:hypothetical protein